MTEQGWKRLWESYMRDLNVKYGYHVEENKNRPGGLPMGIDTFTPHQLRHTFCTLMYFASVDVMTARDQMGHKDISVTLGIYTALDQKFKKKKSTTSMPTSERKPADFSLCLTCILTCIATFFKGI